MDKVVIDTNIFISGLLFGGNPEKVLKAWISHKFILCISPELQVELVIKLQNKFGVKDTYITSLLVSFDEYAEKYIPHKKISLVRDPNDNFLLELAEEAQAEFLITGDKDLLSLGSHKSTRIVTPREFLNTNL